MRIEYKDYYQILGANRHSTDEEIRKAFRKLARQFHPDVATDKIDAEAKFKEINEAYEVLGDSDKRRKYDALGGGWKQGSEFQPPPNWNARTNQNRGNPDHGNGFEFQFGGTGFSEFFDQMFGGKRNGNRQGGAQSSQAAQHGEDIEADIVVSLQEVLRGSIRPITVERKRTCDRCQGTKYSRSFSCPGCGGAGHTAQLETYQVKIPLGIREKQRLRLAGRGDLGSGCAKAGDLYLRIRYEQHPDFRAVDADLFHDLDIAPWEAVLGAQISVPTLDGNVNVKVPQGSQSGQRLRLHGYGLPQQNGARGDLYVVLRIRAPETLGTREKALWQELAQESDFRPRE